MYQDHKKRCGEKYSTPQLRLWARMVTANLHEDLDTPPSIPAFGNTPKRPRQGESLSDAIGGVALVIVKALKEDTATKGCKSSMSTSTVSPTKSVELRMKNFEQLRYLQQLFEDGIITQEEYAEQKQSILCASKKL